jgi:hypothetical protein
MVQSQCSCINVVAGDHATAFVMIGAGMAALKKRIGSGLGKSGRGNRYR